MPPVAKPRLAAIPQSLKQECAFPSDLPAGALTMKVAAPYWARDRIALGECRLRHKALAIAATALEGQGGN